MPDQEALGVLLSKIVVDVADLKKGLSEGRREMQDFKGMAQGVGEAVKKALTFTGISIGIYEVVSALKDFAKETALYGARTETLEIAAIKIGRSYGMSAEAVKYYVDQVKAAGINTQEALLAVSKFLTQGLPLDQLKDLATRARDIGVIANVNTSEALGRIIHGIISGQQDVLRTLMINVPTMEQVYKRYAATLGTTADQLNSVQKAQAWLNEVMRVSAGFAGVAAEADKTVGKQLASMERFAQEAKNALWALFEPIMLQGVQELTNVWKELKAWADANRTSLMTWGREIAGWLREVVNATRETIQFMRQHRGLIKTALELIVFSKAAGWIKGFGGALAGTIGTITTAAKESGVLLTTLTTLVGGPWKIAIMVSLFGLAEAYREIKNIQARATLPGTTRTDFMWPWQVPTSAPAPAPPAPTSANLEVPFSLRGRIGATDLKKPEVQALLGDYLKSASPDLTELYKAEAAAAQKQAEAASPKAPSKATKSGGKETINSLLAPYLAMLKAKRDAELQEAKNSLDLLKETDNLKKAELERALAAQEIDGATYYQRLQELQRQETATALAEIDKKRQAQEKAYRDLLAQLEADRKLTPEAKDIARQKLEAENRKAMLVLDAEAAKTRLEGEVKVTEELKRQADIRRDYRQKTEDLNLETAQLLGAVSEQEATLQKLYLDWQRTKQDAIKAGASPEYLQALEQNYQAKRLDTQYSGLASSISQGLSSLVDTVTSGGRELLSAANDIFRNLFDEALKPGLDQLKNLLVNGFRDLFGESAAGLSGALMGTVGLVGMFLTSGGGSSSWSASGVHSGVTAHEAVRGIIAGESSIPIAEIATELKEALLPTNGILRDGFEAVVNAIQGSGRPVAGGVAQVQVDIKGIEDTVNAAMDRYFRNYLTQGAAG